MGKKTDRMYITQQEWALDFGGAKKTRTSSDFVRLPFSCCAISLKPFEHPVCSPDGIVFDLTNIIPWLAKHGNNPVTGLSLDRKQLVKLNFYQTQGEYQCPVTFKTFSDNTHIVAIKTTGNVFSYDAVDKLNIQAKNYKDLLTDEPFTKKDIITLQDPHQLSLRNINSFHYKVNDISVQTKKEKQELSALPNLINAQGSTKRILDEMQKSVSVTPSFVKPKERSRNEAHFSTGLAAASLTSTHFNPSTKNEAALITDQDYLLANVKDKALVQIATSKGTMQFQLNCKECPQTTFNFIQLANKQYYDNLKFHRLIRGFMMQSGDPTGTGSGGDSIWGKPFVDELASNLKHNCKGMLAMANKGPNTNRSQFYITFDACAHLDKKHTVFGKCVSGIETLDSCQAVGTNANHEPLEPIILHSIKVLLDPFQKLADEFDPTQQKRYQQQQQRLDKLKRKAVLEHRSKQLVGEDEEVGKYLKRK